MIELDVQNPLDFLPDSPDSPTVIPAETAVARISGFTELAVFQTANPATAIRETLLDKYTALQAYVIAKKWTETFEEAEEALKADAINQSNAKKEIVEIGGLGKIAEVTEKRLPGRWTYNDSTLDNLKTKMQDLKQAIKEREEMLQTLKGSVADTETGEILNPAVKVESGITIAVKYEVK